MENDTTRKQAEEQELIVLLRALRVEAAPEAHFEERFLYDFRERLVREAVCRPARMLLWEHLLHAISNFGRRRLLWGASSFGLGMLCLGTLAWQHSGGSARSVVAQSSYGSPVEPQPLMANRASAEDVVRTTVRRRTSRRAYTESLAARTGDAGFASAGGEDDWERLPFSSLSDSLGRFDADMSMSSDLMMHVAH